MSPFADEVTEEIYRSRFSTCAPEHVVVAAHKAIHVVRAAGCLGDVAVAGTPVKFRSRPGTFGVLVAEKWHVTFQWDAQYGAHEIKFERCKQASAGELETYENGS